jgi:hypothetical protein
MALFLLTFGIAYASVCVWLSVRIVNRRELWAKWTMAATLALTASYPLSMGPLQWLDERSPAPELDRQAD